MSWLDSKTDDELFDNSTLCVTAKEYQDLNVRLGLEIGKKQERIEELEKVCAMALEELDADGVYGLDHVVTKLRTVLGEK